MTRKLFFTQLIILGMIFSSCATKPKFEGTANLTGMIVDELNQPVSGFSVSAFTKKKNFGTSFTNESGIFVIHNVPSGEFRFSGQKEGYTILESEEEFSQRDKIFCFQVLSADVVLDKVEEKILQDDFENAIAILKTIYAKPNSVIYEVVSDYENFITSNIIGVINEIESDEVFLQDDEVEDVEV